MRAEVALPHHTRLDQTRTNAERSGYLHLQSGVAAQKTWPADPDKFKNQDASQLLLCQPCKTIMGKSYLKC